MATPSPLLEVKELGISFVQYDSRFEQRKRQLIANLSLSVDRGELVAIVGASGSGKSLLAHAILGLLPSNAVVSGSIFYAGAELTSKRQGALRGKEIALIPQSVTSLDPLLRVGTQVADSLREGGRKERKSRVRQVFARYGLSSGDEQRYPYQLSGGMARRVLVATAVLSEAKLLIADEPTPGLHPEVVQETLHHLRELADEGRGVMLITHDISTALPVADRIAVFYAGTIVEVARTADFDGQGERLRHPYSRALWQALPQNTFQPIPGSQPSPANLPTGCLFAPRCAWATEQCNIAWPELRELRDGLVRCYHAT